MDSDTVIEQIENVDIQGATAVARAGVELLQELHEAGKDREELETVADRLKAARPTEPMLFNAIDIALRSEDYAAALEHIDSAQQEIQRLGAELVEDGSVVYTHCHSSTVTETLINAVAEKDFSVRCTETRPLYQGRTTAKELADAGILVELFVDSGARIALKEADVMLIGADAVEASGHVLNKIGSEMFARMAQEYGTPVYVLTDSWKFDHRSVFGFDESLEQRVGDEVWPDAPENVEVINYAFERIAPECIDGIVSELGEHRPKAFVEHADHRYHELTGTSPEA